MNKLCYIQESCHDYLLGDNKPRNNDVRNKVPCIKWLDGSCDIEVGLRLHHGEIIACNIEDVKKKRRTKY